MKNVNDRSNPVLRLSTTSLFVAIALGSYSSTALSSDATLANCGGLTQAECDARYGNSGETSCDMGQMHEELIDRFKLPEIPSSLEDCGIGGFLNFDFSFGIGDFDFSSLFCDFAQDVVGNFKENMAVDFNIGMNGISINSPIYSMQTKGADEAVDELLYGATGVEQNGRGLLGEASDAYRGTVSKIKREYSKSPSGPAGQARNSFNDFRDRVRSNSSVSMNDVRRNIDAIQDVEVSGNTNSNVNNTSIPNPAGGRVTIGGNATELRDSGYTEQQLQRFNSLPSSQRNQMNERELAEYLGLSEQQRFDQGILPEPGTSNGRRDPNYNQPVYRGTPVTKEPVYKIGNPVINQQTRGNNTTSRFDSREPSINPPTQGTITQPNPRNGIGGSVGDRSELQNDPTKRLQDILFSSKDDKR